MSGLKRTSWLASLVIADAVALVLLFPRWAELDGDVTAPRDWVAHVGADRAAITLGTAALWCVALWLAIGLTALAVATVPGRVGRGARRLARQMLPAVLLRTVAGVAGISVLIAPVAAGAKAVNSRPATAGSANATAQPVAGWPTDGSPRPQARIGWPTDQAPLPSGPAPRPALPGPGSSAAVPTPSLPTSPAPSAAASDHSRGAGVGSEQSALKPNVLVKPGDSLWLITAQRLGAGASEAAIADAWPSWYAANEDVIGPDPALIHPGQVLHAPSDPTSTKENA